MRLRLCRQALIPLQVLRHVVLVEEAGLGAMEEGLCSQSQRVAPELEVQIGIEVDGQRSRLHSSNTQLGSQIEVERLTLRLRQLSAHIQTMFRILSQIILGSSLVQGRHLVVAHLVGDEALQTSLHILVKAFEQRQSEGVLDAQILVFVVDALPAGVALVVLVVEGVSIVVRRRETCIVGAVVVVQVQRVDDAGDGHVLLLHRRIDRVLLGLLSHQTVHLFLRLHFDACGVSLFCRFSAARFVAHDLRIRRTSLRRLADRLIALAT